MKLQALAATLLATMALGGSALAQATMQPIPNPPEKAMSATGHMHKHMKKHHSMKTHMKAKAAADTSATPAATPAPQ